MLIKSSNGSHLQKTFPPLILARTPHPCVRRHYPEESQDFEDGVMLLCFWIFSSRRRLNSICSWPLSHPANQSGWNSIVAFLCPVLQSWGNDSNPLFPISIYLCNAGSVLSLPFANQMWGVFFAAEVWILHIATRYEELLQVNILRIINIQASYSPRWLNVETVMQVLQTSDSSSTDYQALK